MWKKIPRSEQKQHCAVEEPGFPHDYFLSELVSLIKTSRSFLLLQIIIIGFSIFKIQLNKKFCFPTKILKMLYVLRLEWNLKSYLIFFLWKVFENNFQVPQNNKVVWWLGNLSGAWSTGDRTAWRAMKSFSNRKDSGIHTDVANLFIWHRSFSLKLPDLKWQQYQTQQLSTSSVSYQTITLSC